MEFAMLNIFYLKYFLHDSIIFFLKEKLLELKESSDILELEKLVSNWSQHKI